MFRFYFNSEKWNPTREQWLAATRCITTKELERIHRFVFQRDAKSALVGQLLIRFILSKAFPQSSSSFVVERTPYGRPQIISNPSFDFNLSHQYQLVCIAGTFDGRVGCDTMEYRVNAPRRDSIESTANLLQREFTPTEYDFIVRTSSDETVRFQHFHRIWSLKESYVKWLGQGVGYPLAQLNFSIRTREFDSSQPDQIVSDTNLEINQQSVRDELRFDEQIVYLDDNEQQILTVCLKPTHQCQPFVEVSIEDLLNARVPLNTNENADENWWLLFEKQKLS